VRGAGIMKMVSVKENENTRCQEIMRTGVVKDEENSCFTSTVLHASMNA
jgi:hypothetical protein